MSRRARALLVLYGALALFVTPVFPHFLSPNEFARWAVAASVAERGTVEVSRLSPLLGPGFEDLSGRGGRLYANKAPGLAAVALPGYLAARLVVGPPTRGTLRPSLTAMRLVGATLPVLLLGVVFAKAAARFGGDPSRIALALFALLFATPLLAYGLLLFSHALAAAGLFGAWTAVFLPGDPRRLARREVLAGALLGLAVLAEPPVAVPAAFLVGCAAWRRGVARPLRILLGAAPFAACLLAYNAICFGGPFEFSSGHELDPSFRSLAASGVFGVSFPSPGVFLRLLFDPSKGLFVFAPVLLLGIRALPLTARVLGRTAAAALGLLPLSLLLLYAGYPNWHGGFTVGPRYLVPVLPFLVFPLVFREGGRLEAFLLGASAGAVALTTLVFPFVPPGFPLPWGTFSLPLLSRGAVVPNLLHLWPGGGPAVVAPFLFVVLAAAAALGRARLAVAAVGAALWISAGILWNAAVPVAPRERLVRGYVADVYFGRRGALEQEIAATGAPQPRLLSRREAESRRGPGDWPFGR
jgi:hypothetical protein